MDQCCFCGSNANSKNKNEDGEAATICCPRCGDYDLTNAARTNVNTRIFDRWILSGWIREQNAVGITPYIDSHDIDRLARMQRPALKECIERFILAAAERSSTLDGGFNVTQDDLIGISYSRGPRDTSILVEYLTNRGLLEKRDPPIYRVTPEGHIAADEMRSRRAKSSQGFVAMWFAPKMKSVYENGLYVGIQNAGYKPLRVDQKEHANKIDDEIIAEIRRSAFVVADFTDHRSGVYFEAGFAMGLGLPVIWTCKRADIKGLHFDIRQYNCIDWTDANELATRLSQRIEAVLGRGPVISDQQVALKN